LQLLLEKNEAQFSNEATHFSLPSTYRYNETTQSSKIYISVHGSVSKTFPKLHPDFGSLPPPSNHAVSTFQYTQ